MKKRHVGALTLCGLVLAFGLRGDPPAAEFKTFAARQAKSDYDTRLREIARDSQSKLAAVQKDYIAKLEKAKLQATQKGDLEDAVQMKEVIAKLKADIAEPAPVSRLHAEQTRLAGFISGTLWTTNGVTYKFNADGTGMSSDAKDEWLWTPINGREIYMKIGETWTNRLIFDDQLSSFVFQEYGYGTMREKQAGKRVKRERSDGPAR
jgi:hypothetical protein